MALQPSAGEHVDRTTQSPFLLRLFWRNTRPLEPYEFSLAPQEGAKDYYALLPYEIRSKSVEIYTWPSCTLRELTGLLTSVLAPGTLPDPAAGTRLVYKLIFPDTRAQTQDGRGKWIDKPLGSVVIGEEELAGDSEKSLADARFVIGDYIACSIYPPQDGRAVPPPPPPGRPNGGFRRSGPPSGDWRRGERPPGGGYNGYNSGYNGSGGRGGGGGGGYRGGRDRPY